MNLIVSAPRVQCIPSVYLIPVRGEEILIARRVNTGYADGYYSLVAGHLEEGENLVEAMRREAMEEAGITMAAEDMTLVHVTNFKRRDGESVDRLGFYFRTETWLGEPRIMEPDKCDDMRWCSYRALPETMVNGVRQAVERAFAGDFLSLFGWDKT